MGQGRRRGSSRRELALKSGGRNLLVSGLVTLGRAETSMGGRVCVPVPTCLRVLQTCARVPVYGGVGVPVHACGRSPVSVPGCGGFIRQVRTPRLIRTPPPTDTGPEFQSASAWRLVGAGAHSPPCKCLSVSPPPAAPPFEPVMGGAPRLRDRESQMAGAKAPWCPGEAAQGCCPHSHPGSRGRPPPSSLAPPGCPGPCPRAPPQVAFCSHHINHRPGQDRVREQGWGGHSPWGLQTDWLPVTPDSPGQGVSRGQLGGRGGAMLPWACG